MTAHNYKVIITKLLNFITEILKSFSYTFCTTEVILYIANAEAAHYSFVVNPHISGVGEEIVKPIRNNVALEVLKTGWMLTVSCFPKHCKLFHICIFCVEMTVNKCVVEVSCLDRSLLFGGIPAVKLIVNTVFNHKLDFPVGCFGKSFVIIAENRFDIVIRRNAVPACVSTFSPE